MLKNALKRFETAENIQTGIQGQNRDKSHESASLSNDENRTSDFAICLF
jgi:hypothetical protein